MNAESQFNELMQELSEIKKELSLTKQELSELSELKKEVINMKTEFVSFKTEFTKILESQLIKSKKPLIINTNTSDPFVDDVHPSRLISVRKRRNTDTIIKTKKLNDALSKNKSCEILLKEEKGKKPIETTELKK